LSVLEQNKGRNDLKFDSKKMENLDKQLINHLMKTDKINA